MEDTWGTEDVYADLVMELVRITYDKASRISFDLDDTIF